MKYKATGGELKKMIYLVAIWVFLGLLISEARDYLLTIYDNPLVVGLVGAVIFAYLFEIK